LTQQDVEVCIVDPLLAAVGAGEVRMFAGINLGQSVGCMRANFAIVKSLRFAHANIRLDPIVYGSGHRVCNLKGYLGKHKANCNSALKAAMMPNIPSHFCRFGFIALRFFIT
jgi:hypothetical protein